MRVPPSSRVTATFGAVALLVGLLVSVPTSAHPDPGGEGCSTTSLDDLGFEVALADGHPACWGTTETDDVVVVGSEGPATSPTYAARNITVTPRTGSAMLRLGSPKDVAESQDRGPNRVTQTFTPTADTLRVSFRLFSWEHRGRDRFAIDLRDAAGRRVGGASSQPSRRWGSPCDGLYCVVPDVGKRGDFLDSGAGTANGWTDLTITGVPLDRGPLTLSYEASGTDDNAHATWAYLDRPNTPPVAAFSSTPAPRYEGAPLQLVDASYDPDEPEDRIIAWSWEVRDGASLLATSTSQSPYWIPPDDGDYQVTLVVQDTQGATDSETQTITVVNAPPVANALDLEVLAGQTSVRGVGRFLDPGWTDEHTVAWGDGAPVACDADHGPDPDPTCDEDHDSGLGTGLSQPTLSVPVLAAGGSVGSTFSVSDGEGVTAGDEQASADDFTITAIVDDPAADRLGGPGAAVDVTADAAHLGWIGALDDVDLGRLRLPGASGAQAPPAGTEFLVTLRDLPADYDLAVLAAPSTTTQTSPFSLSPFSLSPFSLSPFSLSPFSLSAVQRSPFSLSPFSLSPFSLSGTATSPFSLSPFSLSPFSLSPFSLSSLSQLGFTGLEGDELGGGDISVAELGLGDAVGEGWQVAGFSANRGTDAESVLVRVEDPATELYVAVWGANGAHSTAQPYTLQVEASVPFESLVAADPTAFAEAGFLGDDVCSPDVPPPGPSGELYAADGDPTTLIVTSPGRLAGSDALLSGTGPGASGPLRELADAVDGVVVAVDPSVYAAWDANPCDVGAANAVAETVRGTVQRYVDGGVEHVVLVGGDDVIPHRRVPGETPIGNESGYLLGSFLQPGSPLFASVAQGYNLTDDYYVDADPTPFNGRFLYVPDVPIGRLVESTDQIAGTIDRYLATGGQLDLSTAFVAAHDFLADGAAAAADALGGPSGGTPLAVDRLIDDPADPNDLVWTADDLRCGWLAEGCAPSTVGAPHDVNLPNSHWTHFAALSDRGFADPAWSTDYLTSDEVATATWTGPAGPQPSLLGTITFTVGCHAGLAVPDDEALAADPGLGVDPSLDFAEALASQRAGVFVASTGYGLGDDAGIAGTERLMVLFAEELARLDGTTTAGQALVAAKQRYVAEQATLSVYDEKSLIQTVLYGLPTFTGTAGQDAEPLDVTGILSAASLATQLAGDDPTSATYPFAPVTTADGTYWTVDGDAQATAGRPVQPRSVTALPAGDPAHGVLVTGGTFSVAENVDPVIVRPTTEWETDVDEAAVCLDAWWPSSLARVNTVGDTQTLVVVPGQFRCDGLDVHGDALGRQRLFDTLAFDVLRSNDPDRTPPRVTALDLLTVDGDVTLEVTTPDADATRTVVLVLGTDGTVDAVDAATSGAGTHVLPLASFTPGDDLVIQVADTAGNVTALTGKGAGIRPIAVSITSPSAYEAAPTPTAFSATVSGFTDLVGPVTYLWRFGDGTTQTGTASSATVTGTHTYAADRFAPTTVELRVTDADGATGSARVVLERRCDATGDGALAGGDDDLSTCSVVETAATLSVRIGVVGHISPDVQYRLLLDGNGDGTPNQQVKYSAGSVTGPVDASVTVTPDGSHLVFALPLAEVPRDAAGIVRWSAEGQAGVPGAPAAGRLDRMPETGGFAYTLGSATSAS